MPLHARAPGRGRAKRPERRGGAPPAGLGASTGKSGTGTWRSRFRHLVLGNDRIDYSNVVKVLAAAYGPRPALYLEQDLDYPGLAGRVVTWSDMDRFVDRVAAALHALGVGHGDRVASVTLNRAETLLVNFAVAAIGAVPVPLSAMLQAPEIEHVVSDCGARLLVTDEEVFRSGIKARSRVPSAPTWLMISDTPPPAGFLWLRDLVERAPGGEHAAAPRSQEDLALVFYTSGTTGFPKGSMLSGASLMATVRPFALLGAILPARASSLAFLVFPLAHGGGYQNLLIHLAWGRPVFLVGRFDARHILEEIQARRPTFFAGSPAMYRMLLAEGAERFDLSSVRVWGGGADAFSDDIIRAFRAFGRRGRHVLKPLFVTGYGMAETAGSVAICPPFPVGDGCVGWVLPGVRHRLVDVHDRRVPRGRPGELVLKGNRVLKGYWNDPAKTEECMRGGWFHTGDIMRRGRLGLLYYVEREKDVIKSGGYSVFPAEAERVLKTHPAVTEAVVVGVADRIKGELPVAAVSLRQGAAASEEELEAWLRERVASYKCPRTVFVVDRIPLTYSMKPKRSSVRSLAGELWRRRGDEERVEASPVTTARRGHGLFLQP